MCLEFRTSLTKTGIIFKQNRLKPEAKGNQGTLLSSFSTVGGSTTWEAINGTHFCCFKKYMEPHFYSPPFCQRQLKNLLSEVIKARREEKHEEEKREVVVWKLSQGTLHSHLTHASRSKWRMNMTKWDVKSCERPIQNNFQINSSSGEDISTEKRHHRKV